MSKGIAYTFVAAVAILNPCAFAQTRDAGQSEKATGSTAANEATTTTSQAYSIQRDGPALPALQKRIDLSFSGLSLQQAADQLSRAINYRIALDPRVKTTAKVSIEAQNVPAFRILMMIVHQPGTGMLMISPKAGGVLLEPCPTIDVNGKRTLWLVKNPPWSDAWIHVAGEPFGRSVTSVPASLTVGATVAPGANSATWNSLSTPVGLAITDGSVAQVLESAQSVDPTLRTTPVAVGLRLSQGSAVPPAPVAPGRGTPQDAAAQPAIGVGSPALSFDPTVPQPPTAAGPGPQPFAEQPVLRGRVTGPQPGQPGFRYDNMPYPDVAYQYQPQAAGNMGLAPTGYTVNGALSVMVTALSEKSFVVTEPGLGPKNEVGLYITVYRIEGSSSSKGGEKIREVSRVFHRSANVSQMMGSYYPAMPGQMGALPGVPRDAPAGSPPYNTFGVTPGQNSANPLALPPASRDARKERPAGKGQGTNNPFGTDSKRGAPGGSIFPPSADQKGGGLPAGAPPIREGGADRGKSTPADKTDQPKKGPGDSRDSNSGPDKTPEGGDPLSAPK